MAVALLLAGSLLATPPAASLLGAGIVLELVALTHLISHLRSDKDDQDP